MAFESVGMRIRSLRVAAGMTSGQVATKIGAKTILVWENEMRCPSILSVRNLSNLFKVDKCWLAFGEDHSDFSKPCPNCGFMRAITQ